jgi:hypothetical protein
MRSRFRPSAAMIVACIALFVALGGTATAVTYVVSSNSQVGPGTISGHKPPGGKHPNIIAGSINGTDIADQSGVDTCRAPLTAKYGPICVGSDGTSRTFKAAQAYCVQYGLRLPSFSEAVSLATNYDVPGVGAGELFWTDAYFFESDIPWSNVVYESGDYANAHVNSTESHQTVCVTEPQA